MQPESEFVPNAGQLRSVWLEAIAYDQNDEYDAAKHTAVYSLDIDHRVIVPDDDNRDLAFIEVDLTVGWTETDPEPFSLSLTGAASFGWPEDRPVEARTAWTEYNGTYLVWPYMRAWVSSVTSLSGLGPFVLPTLAVPRPEPWQETGEHPINEGADPADHPATAG